MATGYARSTATWPAASRSSRTSRRCSCTRCCDDRNERAGRDAHPASRCSRSRRAPSCDPTRRTPTRCPPYDVLDPIIEGYVEERPLGRRARGRGLRPRRPCAGSRRSSTATSTSGARRRRACASRPRRSARTAGSRSPTAGPAERRSGRDRTVRSARERAAPARARARRATFLLRRHVLDRPGRARRHHADRVHPAALRDRRRSCSRRSRCAGVARPRRRPTDTTPHVPARRLVARRDRCVRGLLDPERRARSTRRRRTRRSSPGCSSCSRRSSRRSSAGASRRQRDRARGRRSRSSACSC